jgi:hypothetical protein
MKLLRVVPEIGGDNQYHLSIRDGASLRRTHCKLRLEECFKIRDCSYRSKTHRSLAAFCTMNVGNIASSKPKWRWENLRQKRINKCLPFLPLTFQLDACLRVGFECPPIVETHEDLRPIVSF